MWVPFHHNSKKLHKYPRKHYSLRFAMVRKAMVARMKRAQFNYMKKRVGSRKRTFVLSGRR